MAAQSNEKTSGKTLPKVAASPLNENAPDFARNLGGDPAEYSLLQRADAVRALQKYPKLTE